MRGILVTIALLGIIGLGIPVMNCVDRFLNKEFPNGETRTLRRSRRTGK